MDGITYRNRNMFSPFIAESDTHDFFSDAQFEIRIRPVILPEGVEYKFGTPLTTADGVNYEAAVTNIFCVLANNENTTDLTDPKDREVAAYYTGGFNGNKVDAALEILGFPVIPGAINQRITDMDTIEARRNQIDIKPWQEAPVPIDGR